MPINRPDPIFQGVTLTGVRRALRVLMEEQYAKNDHSRFVNACVGGFATVETAADAGVLTNQLVTSDMSLYTSVLGYVLDPTHKIEELGFEVLDVEKFFQEKKQRGAVFSLPPATADSGRKRAVLLDPDGLPIRVTEEIR